MPILLFVFIALASSAFGQTMVTADTLGKDKVAGFAAFNAWVVKDFATLVLSITQVWYGVNDRASRNFGKLTLYTGYSANVPLGNAAGKLFTPARTIHNLPVGIYLPRGKWGGLFRGIRLRPQG